MNVGRIGTGLALVAAAGIAGAALSGYGSNSSTDAKTSAVNSMASSANAQFSAFKTMRANAPFRFETLKNACKKAESTGAPDGGSYASYLKAKGISTTSGELINACAGSLKASLKVEGYDVSLLDAGKKLRRMA